MSLNTQDFGHLLCKPLVTLQAWKGLLPLIPTCLRVSVPSPSPLSFPSAQLACCLGRATRIGVVEEKHAIYLKWSHL